MQQNNSITIDLKFIIITEQVSFIPDNILKCCEIIHIPRPTKSAYFNCIKNNNSNKLIHKHPVKIPKKNLIKLPAKLKVENITNIKFLYFYNEDLIIQHKIICNKIIHNLINIQDLQFFKFRDILYDIFIYNLDISNCIWYILSTLVEQKKIKEDKIPIILKKTYCFFQYYNNNYRPIYHVENYLLYLAKLIHNL
jgi:hypothetical protein